MEERRLTTVNKPPPKPPGQPLNASEIYENLTTLTTDDLYDVNGKKGVSAKVARAFAIKYRIQTRIIEYGKNKEQAWCKTRGWIGLEENPEKETEAVVVFVFEQILQQMVFDAISGGFWYPIGDQRDQYGRLIKKKQVPSWKIDENGFPKIVDPWAQWQIMANFLDKIKFAERTVASMAERNVIIKLVYGEDEHEAGERQPERTKNETPDELEIARNRIGVLLLKIHDGNKQLAQTTFLSIVDSLKISAKSRAEIKTLNDANKILAEITKQMKPQEEMVEIEPEDDPDLYKPITPEEEARMTSGDQ